MKTLNQESTTDIFNEFALSAEEMIYVKGGDGDPVAKPFPPPIKF